MRRKKKDHNIHFDMKLESLRADKYKLCPSCGIRMNIEKLDMNFQSCDTPRVIKLTLKCLLCKDAKELGYDLQAA